MKKQLFKYCVLSFVLLSIFSLKSSVLAHAAQVETLPKLVLSELQTGGLKAGVEDGRQEFIELYNPAATSLDVTGWRVEYLSASHNGAGAATRTLAVLEGEVMATGYALLSYESFITDADVYFGAGSTAAAGLLARSGGHVRIVDAAGQTIDLVGWGTGVAIGDWWKVPEIPAGSSVQRILPGHAPYGTALGFAAIGNVPTPYGGGLRVSPIIESPEILMCSGLILSELLPNPAGADTGKEFIEIHNPTAHPVSLKGCALRLGDTGKTFTLPDEVLQPKSYRAFSDSDTGITLPNATPQAVWLLSSSHEEGVAYDAGLSDGISWARNGDSWNRSSQPTPGASNIFVSPPPDEADEGVVLASTTSSCPEGKERNPATGRCRAIESLSEPVPCKPGQTRNPETNRCRTVTVATGLTPCKPDQERNPDTNRCRSIAVAATGPQPCGEGQERNPETNRCRKSQAAATLPKVEDVATPASAVRSKLWIGGVVAAAVVGYAVYEWRQDILQAASRFRKTLEKLRKGKK